MESLGKMRHANCEKNSVVQGTATNPYYVLKALVDLGPISLRDLTQATSISRPTLHKVLRYLEENGLIHQVIGESTGGRPPYLHAANADARFVIGVEFDIPRVRIDLFSLAYEHLNGKEYYLDLSSTRNPDQIIREIGEETRGLLVANGVSRDRVLGIGMAVTGFMSKRERVSYFTPRIRGWKNVAIGLALEDYLGIPVQIESQSSALALAEMEFGTTKDVDTFCYINFGHGVGAGLVLNGDIYDGPYGNAGLIGHITMDENGPRCICGNQGCLEVYASERVLQERLINQGTDLTMETILEAARTGNEPYRAIVEEAMHYLGMAIANLVNIFEYQLIVLPKTFEAGGQWILDIITQETCSRLQEILCSNLEIRVASIERRVAVSLGGAIPVWRDFYGVNRLASPWLLERQANP